MGVEPFADRGEMRQPRGIIGRRGHRIAMKLLAPARDLPLVPLVHGESIVVWRSEVTGFQIQKDGNLRFGGVDWAAPGP